MNNNGARFRPFNPDHPMPHPQHNFWGGAQAGSNFGQGPQTSVYPERNQPPQGFTARNVNPNFPFGEAPGSDVESQEPDPFAPPPEKE